jgi:hypothetical protein
LPRNKRQSPPFFLKDAAFVIRSPGEPWPGFGTVANPKIRG